MEKAKTDFYGLPSKFESPYCASSNMDDAYIISFWALYHTGTLPRALHKSHGYTWIADIKNCGEIRLTIKNRLDHREGVKELIMNDIVRK